MKPSYILTLTCPDGPGIVYEMSGAIYRVAGNILESHQFEDGTSGFFFLRAVFETETSLDKIRKALDEVARQRGIIWKLTARNARQRTLLLVSKLDHCL